MIKNYFYIFVGIIYLTTSIIAVVFDINPLLFFLSIPWSMIVSIFGFLLIHIFDNFSFTYVEFLGTLLNLVIFLKLTLFRSVISNQDLS